MGFNGEKILVGAVWDLTAKHLSQSSPIWVEMGQSGCAI